MMQARSPIAGVAVTAALLAAPSAASAADTYVNPDDAGASDGNNCTLITTPCDTIGAALAQAGANDTVHVDDSPTTYLESIVIDDGKSVIADSFDGALTNAFSMLGTIDPTIKVPAGETAGTVSGFTIGAPGGGGGTIFLEGPARIEGNTINNANSGATALDMSTPAGGTGSVIDGNTFNGDSSTANTAIAVSEGTPTISDNAISTPGNGFNTGVRVSNGSAPAIDGNTFQAIFQAGGNAGIAVYVSDAHVTITDNLMNQGGGGSVNGVIIEQLSAATGATILRNRLFGVETGTGVSTFATADPVTVESTVIAGMLNGIRAQGSTGPTANDGDITATNVTLADNGGDVSLENTHISLGSSIVEDPIATSGVGNPGCTITFSRGPSTLPGACTQFQTTASPGFVSTGGLNAESNDYHLTPASAMIEAGDTAAPAGGILDVDGGPRSCDGDGDGRLRRDIGADEYRSPAGDDCAAPNTSAGKARVKRALLRRKRRARVTFTSTDANSTFRCKLDKGAFKACTATTVFRRLKLGRHTFAAFATDQFGNVDPTPVTGSFRVRKVRRPRR